MINYVKSPNLPVKKVTRVVAGKMPKRAFEAFKTNNTEVLSVYEEDVLQNPVKTHADLQCVHLGDNVILLNENRKDLRNELEKLGFSVIPFSIISGEYPYDCAVNAAFFGRNVICKYSLLNEKLKQYIDEKNLNVINVNQGYSKCSVCVVDGESIITEDEFIKNACEKHGIDVLLIRKGFVRLDGFDYGFIGGASFKSDENTLVFIGDIERHPDFEKIKSFLCKKSINYKIFGETELTDIGSVLPITE